MRKKRFLAALLCCVMAVGSTPAAATESDPLIGLEIDWYPNCEWAMRLYGADRLLLCQNGVWGLYGLDGTEYAPPQFDTVEEFDENGEAAAEKDGKWGKIDRFGNVRTEFRYDTPQEVWLPVDAKISQKDGVGLFGIVGLDGKPLADYQYWNAHPFSYGLAAVQDDQQNWGFVDETGTEVIPCQYWGDWDGDNGFGGDGKILFRTYRGGWHLLDTDGREFLPEGARAVWRAGWGRYGYQSEDGKVGFIDGEGTVVIEPKFAYTSNPKNVMQGNVFDKTGIAKVWDCGSRGEPAGEPYYIDLRGGVVEPFEASGAKDGLSSVCADGRYGFQNADGELVVPCVFEAAGEFENGAALVKKDGMYGLLKDPRPLSEQLDPALSIAWVETDNTLSPLGRDHLVVEYRVLGYGGMMGAQSWGDYGLRNADGEEIVPVAYGATLPGGPSGNGYFALGWEVDEAGEPIFTDYLGRTYTKKDAASPWEGPELDVYREPGPDGMLESGKWGYADPWTGEKVLPAIYDEAVSFREGIGLVRQGEDRFAIDRDGARLFDLNAYGETDEWFADGLLRARDAVTGKWGYVGRTGEWDLPARWDSAQNFQEGLAVVEWNGSYGYLDREGNLVVPCGLERAGSFDNGLAVVTFRGVQGILKNPLDREKVSDWAAEELAEAEANGYITARCREYQTYEITRIQFAELAVGYLEKVTGESIAPAPADTFSDTADEAVRKAYTAGITQRTGEGTFSPGGLLTREQLTAMLWRAMEKAGITAKTTSVLEAYDDGDEVSEWARESMAALISLGVLTGTSETELSPKTPCTVEQVGLLINRAAKSK